MSPRLGREAQFETLYTRVLLERLEQHGVPVRYERDVGIDLGIHFGRSDPDGHLDVTGPKVWFQLKGKHSSTLSKSDFARMESVPIDVSVDHLRFWYAQPEAVYLAIYVEAIGDFILGDVRDLVESRWGGAFLHRSSLPEGQKKARIHVPTSERLTDTRIESMLRHRSMRIDGPEFRGRPLGHRLDPLRCQLRTMVPAEFQALAERLLQAHDYRVDSEYDSAVLFGDGVGGTATISRGRMFLTYEWTHPLLTEFGFDRNSDFRIESESFHAHGPCAVIIDQEARTLPIRSDRSDAFVEDCYENGVDTLLVFVNSDRPDRYLASYQSVAGPMSCIPQGVDSLAFNVLTATNVYLEYRHALDFSIVNYLS